MITWMQRRRKYLVPTIWVSVIAFVGAGFVGWGAYDFSADRASSVAKVENREVTVQEFQLAYANYFNFYNNMLDGGLTQERANQMGLEGIVLEGIINETLILAYADEIGLRVTKAEIKNALASDPSFHRDGVFDIDTYFRALQQSQISPSDYETGLERQILLSKVQESLRLNPTPAEKEIFQSAMFMKSRLAVDVISLGKSRVAVSEDEIKKYWDEHKTDYLTEKSFDLNTIAIELSNEDINEEELKTFYQEKRHNYRSSDGKILSFDDARADIERDFRFKLSRKEALKTYLEFKKSNIDATGTKSIKISDTTFDIEKLTHAKIGDTLKPIETENGHIVVQLKSINQPIPKPYIETRETILTKLQAQKDVLALQQKAEARLGVFKGRDIGFVSRESVVEIEELSEIESLEFVNFVFDNKKTRNFKIVGEKAILYKILEQDLLTDNKIDKHTALVSDTVSQMKQAHINQNLVVNLKKRYKVEQYYKGQ